MADAAISAWNSKYEFNFWRPVTAIRNGDADGNAATSRDATWSSLITTPPFPDYVSGHSTFSGAASTVLAMFYGTDDFRSANEDGLASGLAIGEWTFTNYMRPKGNRSRK